jgi:hypothetical protein
MHRYDPLFESDSSHQIQEKRLSGTVLADYESKCRAAVGDSVDVGDQSSQLQRPTNLDEVLSHAWNHPGM